MINKAEIRPEEHSKEAYSCRENLWKEIQLKVPQRQKQTQEQNKKEWASSINLCHRHKPQHPHHVKVGPWGQQKKKKHIGKNNNSRNRLDSATTTNAKKKEEEGMD